MQVIKTFRFYAAHRNETIEGKCSSIHGHQYGLKVVVEYPKQNGITMLFDEIERRVQPLIEAIDHSLILHVNDPARGLLIQSGACNRIYWMDSPTSAENLAEQIMRSLRQSLNVVRIELQETASSTIILDWNDNEVLHSK